MSSPAVNALVFLLKAVSQIYITVILVRFILQWVRADFYNPISQAIVKITNPVLIPLRRIVPGLGGIDASAIVAALLIQALTLVLIVLVSGGVPTPWVIFIWSISELLKLLFNLYFVTILAQVILSWVNPGGYHAGVGLLHSINQPVLRPAQRLIPPIGGLDLSPLVALLAIQVLQILLIPSLESLMR